MALVSDTSETGIANLALSAAEIPSVLTSMDQPNSKAARLCRMHLPRARDSVLRGFGFAFARGIQSCVEVLPAPVGGDFPHAFAQPTDALRILRVDGLTKREWRTDGDRQILAAVTGPIKVHFIRREFDFTRWDTLAIDLVSIDLALRVVPELAHVQGISARLREQYADLAHRAPRLDAFEQDSTEDDYDDDHYVPGYIGVRA